jgi:hypothetical protein
MPAMFEPLTDLLRPALVPGLGLGGVLAASAAWSRAARSGPVPHLAVGAVAGLGLVVAQRLQARPPVLVLLLVAAAAAVVVTIMLAVERAVTERAGRSGPLPALADLVVLGLVLALTSQLTPALAAPLPFGPLGGIPSTTGGLLGGLLGGAVAVMVASRRPPAPIRPVLALLAGAGVAAAAVLAGGAVAPAQPMFGTLVGLPDTAGLALRAAAAALAGRRGPADAAAAGLALGLVEALLRVVDPVGGTALLPALGAAVLGVCLGPAAPADLPGPRPGLGAVRP